MSDDRELSPEQEERVRRLLAEARLDEPIPGDVAGRLDRVLARLAHGDLDHDPAAVVELASRRRRKVTTMLVAAAAVVAIGVGVSQLSPGASDTAANSTAAGAAPEAAQDELLDSGAAGSAEAPAPAEAPPGPSTEDGSAAYDLKLGRPARIRPAFFADDVARVRNRVALSALATGSAAERGASFADAVGASMCEPADWGAGDLYVVRYAGSPAVLAFRPAAGDTQVVELLQCGTADILRSVTLPAG